MEDLPFSDADAGVTSLVGLVTVMATEILYRAIVRDFDFIDGKKTETLATETFVCLLTCTPTSLGETILA